MSLLKNQLLPKNIYNGNTSQPIAFLCHTRYTLGTLDACAVRAFEQFVSAARNATLHCAPDQPRTQTYGVVKKKLTIKVKKKCTQK